MNNHLAQLFAPVAGMPAKSDKGALLQPGEYRLRLVSASCKPSKKPGKLGQNVAILEFDILQAAPCEKDANGAPVSPLQPGVRASFIKMLNQQIAMQEIRNALAAFVGIDETQLTPEGIAWCFENDGANIIGRTALCRTTTAKNPEYCNSYFDAEDKAAEYFTGSLRNTASPAPVQAPAPAAGNPWNAPPQAPAAGPPPGQWQAPAPVQAPAGPPPGQWGQPAPAPAPPQWQAPQAPVQGPPPGQWNPAAFQGPQGPVPGFQGPPAAPPAQWGGQPPAGPPNGYQAPPQAPPAGPPPGQWGQPAPAGPPPGYQAPPQAPPGQWGPPR
jgi:hypothetical protein